MSAACTSTNRKLLEPLETSRLDNQESENDCDLSELFCNSLFNNIAECDYTDVPYPDLPDTDKQFGKKQTALTFLHINLRSINNLENFDALYEFISSLPSLPDLVCISETRLKGEPLINIAIPDYNFIHADSPTNAGGVGIYILSKHRYELNHGLEMKIEGCEELWINLFPNIKSSQKLIIGAIYRHPIMTNNYLQKFTNALSDSIKIINDRKNTFYVLGDLNIDIATNNKTTLGTLNYIDQLTSCGSVPIITLPTRVTDTSSKIIDHIITNDATHMIKPGVIRCDESLSDHYVTYCSITGHTTRLQRNMYYTIRDKSNFNTELYCDEMCDTVNRFVSTLEEITETNFDNCFNDFVATIQKVIDKHAPVKKISRKQQKLKSKPWITNGIYVSIRHKNRMHKTHYIRGDEIMKKKYKMYANKLTKIKTVAKQKYYTDELIKNKSNPRKTWELLRALLPGNSTKSTNLPSCVSVNETNISNEKIILEKFNDFFSKIGENLAKNFSRHDKSSYENFLSNRDLPTIYMEPPRINEVINVIHSLQMHKSVGHDNISPFYLRVASTIIAPILCYFIDYAFTLGIFPQSCKIAKIIPIFKSGKRDNLTNYRPISILTCFSKIIEKLIHKRLSSFFEKHSVLTKYQYGFRNSMSTTHAILDVLTSAYDHINNNEFICIILLDF